MNRLWVNDPILVNKLEEMEKRMIANETGMSRVALLAQMFDPRRDIDNECGYPKNTFWSADQYQDLYEREPVANRAIQLFPKEAWQRLPSISEDEDSRHFTKFEQAVQDFSQKLSASSWHSDTTGVTLWEHCHRINTLCRVGSFGLLLIGLDDGKDLSEPVDGMVTVNRRLEPIYRVDAEGDPVLNSAGKPTQVGVRVVKEGDAVPAFPDGPILRNELAALRNPVKLTEEQVKAGMRQTPTLNDAEVEIVAKWGRGWVEDAPVYARREEVVNKVATTFSDLTATGQQSIQGTDQQYFGVQFGPTQQPAQKPVKAGEVIFMQEFGEPLVQIVRYEWNIRNPRFGMPVMYRVTLNDPRQVHSGVGLPLATVFVHWSRVIHVHDSYSNPGSSRIFAYPALMPILNPVLDIKKVRGASAEAYWKNCLASLSLETHPQLGGDVDVDKQSLKDMLEQKNNGLQRDIILTGMTAKTIAPQAVDPTPYIATQIEAICIQLGCPIRVFKGAERGELASSQDDADWNDRIMGYCNGFCTPYIIAPLFDRLIMFGSLPEPESYTVKWPDPEALGDAEKATVGLTLTQAMAAYNQGDVKMLVDVEDYMVGVLGMDQDKVEEWVKNAQKAAEDEQADQQALADEQGFEPAPPPGFQTPVDDSETPVDDSEPLANLRSAWNAFCATGEGGGVDPTCSSSEHSSAADSSEKLARSLTQQSKAAASQGVHEVADAYAHAAQATREVAGKHRELAQELAKDERVAASQSKVAAAERRVAEAKQKEADARRKVEALRQKYGIAANEWSDAAREAALEARRAKMAGKEVPEHRMEAEHLLHLGHFSTEVREVAEHLATGHFGIEDIATVVGSALKPLALKVGEALQRVPGAKAAGHALVALHDKCRDIAHAAIVRAIERYGHGAVSAAIGVGGFASTMAAKSVGLGAAEAVGHNAAKYVGAMPILALAEVGHQLGVVAPHTKLDKGLTYTATKLFVMREAAHIIARSAVSKVISKVTGGKAPVGNADIVGEILKEVGDKFTHEAKADSLLLQGDGADHMFSALESLTTNAFCATGEGGGVDPTCSPSGGRGGGGDAAKGLKGSGTKEDPYQCGADIEKAAVLLAGGHHITLAQPDQVSSLLDKIASVVSQAKAAGKEAPKYNLCNVSVPKTNLFCQDSLGIPRIKMPQLDGSPLSGTKAAGMPREKNGNVDVGPAFIEYMASKGVTHTDEIVLASHLRASQGELVGSKVAGMVRAAEEHKFDPTKGAIYVTKDNYIIDGHHRWATIVGLSYAERKDIRMPVRRLNIDIGTALDHANQFTKDIGIAPQAG